MTRPACPRPPVRRFVVPERLLAFPGEPSRDRVVARAVLLVVLAGWGAWFATRPVASQAAADSFLHGVNLVFHEAGHVILSPFGRFLHVLGGSLFQVLIPGVCLAAFLVHTRDAYAAAVALWWLGQNLVDLAPYVGDARAQRLLLLGGVTGRDVPGAHDWHYLLRALGLLTHDRALAGASQVLGALVMAAAVGWGSVVLRREWRAARGRHRFD